MAQLLQDCRCGARVGNNRRFARYGAQGSSVRSLSCAPGTRVQGWPTTNRTEILRKCIRPVVHTRGGRGPGPSTWAGRRLRAQSDEDGAPQEKKNKAPPSPLRIG